MDERELLTAWALRFDGWRYCEDTEWSDDDRLATTEGLVNRLEMPRDPFQQLTLFHMLQRHLEKLGGEMLGTSTFDWRTYRTLFLVTASYEIPERWRFGERYDNWRSALQPRTAECISFIANAHAAERYGPARCLGDIEAEWNYYFQEKYLFETVGPKFRLSGSLDAFDFFSIVIWKANRAKSVIASKIKIRANTTSLEEAIGAMATALHAAVDRHGRFNILNEIYGLPLASASAVLSVLWPNDFSIYDVRVCQSLSRLGLPHFGKLAGITNPAALWKGYEEFIDAVKNAVPGTLSLRDKDRVLWAHSASEQLRQDVEKGFPLPSSKKTQRAGPIRPSNLMTPQFKFQI